MQEFIPLIPLRPSASKQICDSARVLAEGRHAALDTKNTATHAKNPEILINVGFIVQAA